MDEILSRVREYTRRYGLLARDETVVVGVSGGPDSLCLLHVLRRMAPELGLQLHVAHLNHRLRGAESDADASFVAGLAARWELPCTVGQADVATLAAEPGLSVEEAARQARYRFLAQVAQDAGAQIIAVGHNADDQAETVLMHFLRGSGVAGLRGMLPKTRLADYRLGTRQSTGAGGQGGTLDLVRPLLAIPRSEIAAYCVEHGLQPRFDRSNEDTTFYRNRLRHELLPALRDYNPAIRKVLAHTAAVMAGDYDLLRIALETAWAQVTLPTSPEQAEVRFDLVKWRALPLGLQRATVREAIHRLRHSLRNINWDHVERAVWLGREGRTGQSATLAAGLALEVGYTALRVAGEGVPWTVDVPQIEGPLDLRTPGVTSLAGGWRVVVHRLAREDLPEDYAAGADPWEVWLDADVVGPALSLCPRLPGDRFRPQGLGGHSTKLNEFMINAKVPRAARAGWPLLFGRAGLAWVCGLRVDERAVVGPETRVVWQVELVRGTN